MSLVIPAGHGAGVFAREVSTGESDLERAFLEWSDNRSPNPMSNDLYRSARNLICEASTKSEDLHALALKYPDCPDMGLFLSAGYAAGSEPVLVYDLDVPLERLGYLLPEQKLLVNRGTTGTLLGSVSAGVIVNIGRTGRFFGLKSSGTIINADVAGEGFGSIRTDGTLTSAFDASQAAALALSPPEGYVLPLPGLIRHDRLSENLREYLEELAHVCAGPVDGIYDRYGAIPAWGIKRGVARLLEACQ